MGKSADDEEVLNTSSGNNRASLELAPLSGNQTSRIKHLIDIMLVKTNNKACQHHNESRHDQKARRAAQGFRGSHELNKGTSKSEKTEDSYKSKMFGLLNWAYQTHGIKDPFQIRANHIKEFCGRLLDNGYSRNGYEGYLKAFSFYEGVLEQYAQVHGGKFTPNWQLQEVRSWKASALDKEHHRAYATPEAIIKELNADSYISARLQYDCGLRVSDATFIKGYNWDSEKGIGKANSKGGQIKCFQPSADIAAQITAAIKDHGFFKIDQDQYRRELRAAVGRAGEAWESTHGLRCAAAERYMLAYKAQGMSYKTALHKTGEFLGHHRGLDEVTKTYVSGVAPW